MMNSLRAYNLKTDIYFQQSGYEQKLSFDGLHEKQTAILS